MRASSSERPLLTDDKGLPNQPWRKEETWRRKSRPQVQAPLLGTRSTSRASSNSVPPSLFHCLENNSEVAQSCPTLWDPMDCSLPGSSVHGIFQARILEWVAISFSRGSS